MWRYDRPQRGRYREHWQLSVEGIGSDDPALDAEVIQLYAELLRRLRVGGYVLELNSIGDANCRPAYVERLSAWLDEHDGELDDEARAKRRTTPLRVFDVKSPRVQALLHAAPKIGDSLCDACREHFADVRALLDAYGVRYTLVPALVRGLDYYTRTTFEFKDEAIGAKDTIAGGGRYDGLMALLGGPPLSGVGYGIGVDRTLLACRVEGIWGPTAPWSEARCDVFGVPLGDAARRRLVVLAAALRRAGVRVDLAYGGRGLKGAMKAADRSGARFALVLGERDLGAGQVGLKDLVTGEQVPVALDAAVGAVVSALR
jgi:histidyl-tRNA synthetase